MPWTNVCKLSDIPPNAGAAVLAGERQVAVFRVGFDVFALDNHDPFSGANVLSRGIVGCIGDELVVASPVYKQHFALRSGVCLEEKDRRIATYPVRVNGDDVMLNTDLAEQAAA